MHVWMGIYVLLITVVVIQEGRTALHWASYKHHIEVVKLLLQYGADMNVQNTVKNL